MSKRIYTPPRWVIVGITKDGENHFIDCSFKTDSWLTMWLKTILYRIKGRYRSHYSKISLRKYKDLV